MAVGASGLGALPSTRDGVGMNPRHLEAGITKRVVSPWRRTAEALAMGAAYSLTVNVNQSCGEAGPSDVVREMLC